MFSRKANKSGGDKYDQISKLTGFYVSQNYLEKLRPVKYYDEETDRTFVFLTNNFDLMAEQIALFYKNRWQIELFFKWIKQHLKTKSFLGNTENAVLIQVYSALIAYCLVAIICEELKINLSTYEILQVLGISQLDRTPVAELLTVMDYVDVKEQFSNQLLINLF